MNLYVGNLSYQTTEEDLRQLFGEFGQVATASLVKDRATGESRGFAFVEMPSQEEAQKAMTGLNGREVNGRALNVNEARRREERGSFAGRSGGDRDNRGGGRGRHE